MPLALRDVLKARELNNLSEERMQYSSLVSIYRRLSQDQLEKIFTGKTSFLELLMDSGLKSKNSDGQKNIRSVLTKILSEKILIGLMAVDKIPVTKIVSTILHMDSNFASDDLVSEICRSDARLVVKGTDKNRFVTLSQCVDVPVGERKMSGNENTDMSSQSVETMKKCLVRYFCKSRPELLRGLQVGAEYKDVLKVYAYWSSLKLKNEEFVSWLFDLAQAYCRNAFDKYKENIYSILSKQVVEFVTASNRIIAQIVDNFCFDKPSFIRNTTIKELVSLCPELLRITDESQIEVLDRQVVTIAPKNNKSLEEPGSSYLECLQDQREANVVCRYFSCDFDLPRDVKSRVTNLLTLRSSLSQILQIYNVVRTKAIVQALIVKHGCFLNFLNEMGRILKPSKLGSEVYDHHLKACTIKFLMSFAQGKDKTLETLKEVAKVATPDGLVDDNFLRDALNSESMSSVGSDPEEGDNDDSFKTKQACGAAMFTPENPLSDLEPRVEHLLTGQPRFQEISNVFGTLPQVAVQTLAESSMSFFEWMIWVCKQSDRYDVNRFESHLHGLVQTQVAKLHVTEHCQMTIQHVHSLLCGDKPMLLSPNFLSYCLERPDSIFYIHQSWIYLHTGRGQQLSGANITDQERKQPVEVINREAFIQSVQMSTSLQQIISVTNCISLAKRDDLMEPGMCWYEYIENNSTRQYRTRLGALLVADVDRLLAGTVQKLQDLWLNISKGSSRFISIEILDEILRQHRTQFALSRNSGQNCYVARVRHVENEDVHCVDLQEEKFLERILLYFPPRGFCDLGDILHEKSDLSQADAPILDVNFLECFFLAFPMLFYLDGNSAILTCMALDYKSKYQKGTENDEDKRRSKRRVKDNSRRNRRKRRRNDFSPAIPKHQEIICIDSSEEDSLPRADLKPGYCDASPDSNDVEMAIESLLPGLVGDMTMSILQQHGGQQSTTPLLKELVSLILGHAEAQIVVGSVEYWSTFKWKVASMIKMDPRFETVAEGQGEDISEVMIAEDGVCHNNDEALVIDDSSQVREVTSTSVSPIGHIIREENVPDRTNADDIIKLSPPRTTVVDEEDDRFCISSTDNGAEGNDKSKSTAELVEVGAIHTDDECGDLMVDSDCNAASNADVSSSKSPVTPTSEASPYVPSYGSLSSGLTAYKYIQAAAPKRNDTAMKDRVQSIHAFTRECLGINAGSYATELLIADAYRRFRNERFARSRLAFEAYMFDYLATNSRSVSLAGTNCDVGVSKVTVKSVRNAKAEHALNTLWSVLPNISPSCVAFLSSRANTRATIESVTQYVTDTFCKTLEVFSETERPYAARCLILVSIIRNLKLFCFAVNEPVVYLRGHKEDATPVKQPNPDIDEKIKPIMQSENVLQAMLLMESIIKKAKPATHKNVRKLWQAEAPKSLINVFGNGISFTLAMRKYSFLFPPAVGGEVSINTDALEAMRKGANC